MDYAVIDRIFEDTRHIGHLCLTGGEPSLAPQVIKEILYRARRWKCTIDSFFCATNAKIYSEAFADALLDLYYYCQEPEHCTLTVTTDRFHEPVDPNVLEQYRKLPFYQPVFEYGNTLPYLIQEEGRAQRNGIGQSEIPIKGSIYDTDFLGFCLVCNDTIYVNAKGDVLLNADLSYQNQEEFCIGNVTADGLPHILSTVLYMPRFSYREQVFRLCLEAEAGTIAPVGLKDKRYYSDESAAMGAFYQMLHNLQITPVNPECGAIPETLKLTIEPKERQKSMGNRLDEATVFYTDKSRKRRAVHIYVEHFPLEDAHHE